MESRQIRQFGTAWNGLSSPFHIFPAFFSPFQSFFHPFLTIFTKNGKKGRQKMEERERKGKRSFQFLSYSHFFPFLSRHIFSARYPYASHNFTCSCSQCTSGVALPPSGAARSQVDQGRRRGYHQNEITKLPQCNG